ncbi:MAG: asparagine synthase (glutamine-hydrolyzing) [Ignavibacterium sp.]|jgi:asparagine synthase (glutamine-hydrolysing)|uniref:asparagine synthase (glutamine-hydrolyzing) n=1 Tax=Ignavibacterium sp. TaxID=2651167 RepID=UPI0032991581
MCGIFGVLNTKEKIDEGRVLAARDLLAHRRPDDAGVYFSLGNHRSFANAQDDNTGGPFVALAHRRLSIIDLSPAAHQPMISDDGRYVIIFNGEIYNFEELMKEVGSRQSAVGNKFKSHSDTEVILKLFASEGHKCLNKLRGMFAFAIWDEKEKTLFAARDRFGIKPFYYYFNESDLPNGLSADKAGEVSFIFSSEIKAIKHYKGNLSLNNDALDAFLRTGSVPAPMTIYNEVAALLPGHWMEIDCHPERSRRISINNYWKFSDLFKESSVYSPQSSNDKIFDPSKLSIEQSKFSIKKSKSVYDSNAKKKVREALLDTIKAHMVADVEVGAFLSGGIDSTAIVSLMRQVGQEKIKTVSVVFPDNKLDESRYARIAAKKYNTEHIEVPIYEKDLIEDFEKIMSVMDQPTIDGINTYFVSKAAKQAGLKVVLSGLGGDELFGGYPSFNLIPKYQRIKNLPLVKIFMKAAAPLLKNRLPAKAIEYMKNPDEPNAEYKLVRGLFTKAELNTLGWNHSTMHPYSHAMGLNEEAWMHEKEGRHGLVKVSYLESCFYMRNQLLRDSDVFSMAHSLELRVPFVDHKLYAAVLPYLDDAYDKKFPKKMLVEAVGDLPDEIVHRPKMGFTFPFEDWIMNGQLKDLMIKRIKDSDYKLNIEHSSLNINQVHWSRLWALFILSM